MDRGLGTTYTLAPAVTRGLTSVVLLGNPGLGATLGWNWQQQPATVVDGLNLVTTYTEDARGRRWRIDKPEGTGQNAQLPLEDPGRWGDNWEYFQRDVHGQVLLHIQPVQPVTTAQAETLWLRTTYRYDTGAHSGGDLLSITMADARSGNLFGVSTQTFQYEQTSHQVSDSWDPLFHHTHYDYSPEGDLLAITDALNQVTTQTYYPDSDTARAGLLKTVTTPLVGHTTTYDYDGNRRLRSVTTALPAVTLYTYDLAGNPSTVTDALNHTTQTFYDGRNQLVQQIDALGNVTSYENDAYGLSVRRDDPPPDPNQPALHTVTLTHYDQRGWQDQLTEAAGSKDERLTLTTHDVIGRVVSLTTGKAGPNASTAPGFYYGNATVTKFTYDTASRREDIYEGMGQDAQGHPTFIRQTTRFFDALGNLVVLQEPGRNLGTNATGPITTLYVHDYARAGELAATLEGYQPLPGATRPYAGGYYDRATRSDYDVAGNLLRLQTGEVHLASDAQTAQTQRQASCGVPLTRA